MSRPGTFERVYAAIKQQLRDGLYRPGDRLEPAVLSEELNASVTPVRDALHRLTGERLVEAPRHEGFRVPMLTETMLRHLYAWHRDLLLLAILNRRAEIAQLNVWPDVSGETASYERRNHVFLALAQATNNPEHLIALRTLTERLEPAQRLEDALLDAVEEETAEIVAALHRRDRKALRRSLVHYQRRRERIVPELLERLYAR
ncbi:MAG TPA: GntR family transcriptional regulator [Sphingomicrobium sp.]|nr:GntR family transcriptional regulator [Sphingomicrobium sp.]HVM23274.1 GntR family transcriptional regulator [Sphingomicrobium sp.]